MREIKVKAWSPSLKEWRSDWSISEYTEVLNLNECKQDEDLILVQYTGLKDKNGKEIWEGDICKSEYTPIIGQIYFGFGGEGEPADFVGIYYGWCFGRKNELDETTGFTGERLEVVGNIYENPELLEGKNEKA